MSEVDVTRALLSEKLERECNNLKCSAVLSFKSGERINGLRSGIQLINMKPLSAKLWTIVFFGLLGKHSINWLFRQYASFRISKIENKTKGIRRSFI